MSGRIARTIPQAIRRALLAATLAALPLPGIASDAVVGQWQCNYSMAGTGPNPSLLWRFTMSVAEGGEARGQGVHTAYGIDYPFSFGGQWWVANGNFGMNGTTSGIPTGNQFLFTSTPRGSNMMQGEGVAPTGTLRSFCERIG